MYLCLPIKIRQHKCQIIKCTVPLQLVLRKRIGQRAQLPVIQKCQFLHHILVQERHTVILYIRRGVDGPGKAVRHVAEEAGVADCRHVPHRFLQRTNNPSLLKVLAPQFHLHIIFLQIIFSAVHLRVKKLARSVEGRVTVICCNAVGGCCQDEQKDR